MFGTKGETLERLAPKVKGAQILPQHRFTVAQWRAAPSALLAAIAAHPWGCGFLIVRSSSRQEDTAGSSMAGRFLSLAGIPGADPQQLADAIERVIASYGETVDPADQVFIQPMLTDVTLSGVAFSRDPSSGAPYVIINYDESGDTAAVTSGRSAESRTAIFWKHRAAGPGPLQPVLALVAELEQLLDHDGIDVEFAFARDALFLLQVRPLLHPRCPVDQAIQDRALETIAHKIDSCNRPHPYLFGKRTVFGVMPDWNPAEIIGMRPRPLALALYRNLVTDGVWAYQRHNYGYKNLRSFPLMLSFEGLPYIDVRVSFNSFIPSDIEDNLAERLVDYYISRLLSVPTLHDKVEFEIVFSCYTLDLPQRLAVLRQAGFSGDDLDHLTDCLRRLTNRIVCGDNALWQGDFKKIGVLEQRRRTIMNSDLDLLSRIYWLIEDCKRYGTLPFAGLARAAFIAVQMLRSLVAMNILDQAQYNAFMTDLDTTTSQMGRDLGTLSRTTFLRKYGHLRPGTYDILSPRYDEAPELYFDWDKLDQAGGQDRSRAAFTLSLAQMKQVDQLLKDHNLEMNVVEMFDFIQSGIKWREHSKFIFTHSLSDIISLLARLGQEHGFSADDMSYAEIDFIKEIYTSSQLTREVLPALIENGRRRHQKTLAIQLPPLITSSDDVWGFTRPSSEPNFITHKRIEAGVADTAATEDLAGRIAVIPSADPGYDWLFTRGIVGLITAYGGVNSHMAIRAGELGLPAVIGAGETSFTKWRAARTLRMDCANRRVEVLS